MKNTKRNERSSSKRMFRYTAKLLFQWRVMVNGNPGVRRLCEERMIVFRSRNARAALFEAKKRGRAGQHRYKNGQGNPVHFEFIGVMDLLRLGAESGKDEVWWDIVQRWKPMERKAKILPPEKRLNAIANDPW